MANNKRRAPALREVVASVLKNNGWVTRCGLWHQKDGQLLIVRAGKTADLFKGYPDKCCALLKDGFDTYPLYSQDFYGQYKG